MIKPPIAFLPTLSLLTPKLFAKIFTNERMGIQMPRIMRIFSPRGVLLFLTWRESFATRLGSNQLMTLSGQESQAISAELQAPFRQPADQRDLTSGEPTAQDPLQARFGKIPLLFGHGLPVVRREQDALILLCGNECLHCKHQSDSCPKALEQDNGH